MLEPSLIKLQILRTATLLKRDSNPSFFLWILSIIQEDLGTAGSETAARHFKNTSFFYRKSPVAVSHIFRFPACNFIKKKETPASMFFCEFCKIFKSIFWQDTSGWLPLVCNWILRNCSDHLFHRVSLGNLLFQVQVAEFQPPDTGKKYFTGAFQAFYTRTRSS